MVYKSGGFVQSALTCFALFQFFLLSALQQLREGRGDRGEEISKCLPAVRYANVYLEIRLTPWRMRNVNVCK